MPALHASRTVRTMLSGCSTTSLGIDYAGDAIATMKATALSLTMFSSQLRKWDGVPNALSTLHFCQTANRWTLVQPCLRNTKSRRCFPLLRLFCPICCDAHHGRWLGTIRGGLFKLTKVQLAAYRRNSPQ